MDTDQPNEQLAQKNLKIAITLAIVSIIMVGVCIASLLFNSGLYPGVDGWRFIVTIVSLGGIFPMVLVIIFSSIARVRITKDLRFMLGMSIPTLVLAAIATVITISTMFQQLMKTSFYSSRTISGHTEYQLGLELNVLAYFILIGASVMDALLIPLGIKDIVVGAEIIKANRMNQQSSGS